MARTRIKICGVRDLDTALAAAEHGADAIGFMFARMSVRNIEAQAARRIMDALPPFISTVGVFVNPSIEKFCDIEEECPTTFAQLHGTEDEGLVRQCGPWLIKGVRFEMETIADELARWDAVDEVDAILVDGSQGGEGLSFDWKAMAELRASISTPIIIAGGLTPENVGEAIRIIRPYGVDVSSGVERERGVKDPALIAAFCNAVRDADRA